MAQKVAYVTGGMGGIGTAICQRLHKEGFKVIAGCGPSRDFQKWLDEQKALGYNFHASVGNVGDWASTVEAFSKTKAEHGSIDVLVNNAGITHRSTFAETSLEVFQRVMAVNYFGALYCTQAALPSLIARGGQIIVLSSLSGIAPLLYRSAYNASKHALHGLFETLRFELKGSGVNVMLVCPGFTATDLRKNALVGDGSVAAQPPLAMGKVASPQDVAEAIYHGALKRRRLLVLSNVDWRARVLARFFPRLFERVLLPRLSGLRPQRSGRN